MKRQQKIYFNKALKNPVLLITATDMIKTKIIEGLLNESDIPYYTKDNRFGGYIKVLMGGPVYGTDFYIGKDDFKAAKDIIDAYFNEPETGDINENTEAEFDDRSQKTKLLIMRIILGVFLLAFITGTIFILTRMFSK
ncbi:MAG: putative signal transducing protein [Saccharofermentanales bacterium]